MNGESFFVGGSVGDGITLGVEVSNLDLSSGIGDQFAATTGNANVSVAVGIPKLSAPLPFEVHGGFQITGGNSVSLREIGQAFGSVINRGNTPRIPEIDTTGSIEMAVTLAPFNVSARRADGGHGTRAAASGLTSVFGATVHTTVVSISNTAALAQISTSNIASITVDPNTGTVTIVTNGKPQNADKGKSDDSEETGIGWGGSPTIEAAPNFGGLGK